jgi:hypothetical protein
VLDLDEARKAARQRGARKECRVRLVVTPLLDPSRGGWDWDLGMMITSTRAVLPMRRQARALGIGTWKGSRCTVGGIVA